MNDCINCKCGNMPLHLASCSVCKHFDKWQRKMTYSQINPTKVGGFSTKRKGEENGR